MPATLVRLGQGEEGTQYFKRALTERAERWVMMERRRRKIQRRRGIPPGPVPKGLDLRWETLQRWRSFPSFESEEPRRTIARGLVPAAMTRVQNLLQEALPAALSLRNIYQHALLNWPVEFHSMELLRRGCEMLLASFLAAETLIPDEDRVLGESTKVRAYKAIQLELSYPDLTQDYYKNLTQHLGEILQCLAEPDPEDPPFIETTRYFIPRDELVSFRKYMQQLRDEQMEALNGLSDVADIGGVASIGAIFSTIRRFSVYL